MRPGPPRRRPFPFDLVLAGTGLMLGRSKQHAPLILSKPDDMASTSPSDYSYTAQNPIFERVWACDDLSLGFGLAVQQAWQDKRTRYCLNADTSIAGLILKGPEITVVTPSPTVDGTNGISHFFEVGTTLYALNGRYALVRGGDLATDWTVSQDFGAGKCALDVASFYPNSLGGVASAFVALGDSDALWRLASGAWSQRVEVQTVAITDSPSAGHYHLLYDGTATAALNYDAAATAVQAALRNIEGLEGVTVTATGTTPNFTHTVTFNGVPSTAYELTADVSALTGGTVTIATTQEALTARALAVLGRDLYRAHDTNLISKVDVDSDPFLEANWGANWGNVASHAAGDKSHPIVRLAPTSDGALLVLKRDGIHTLNAYGDDQVLYPQLRWGSSLDNGKGFGHFLGDLYVSYNQGFYRISPDYTIEEVGPERYLTTDLPVRGRVTAFAGHDSLHAYAGLYDDDTGDSYLLKLGSWRPNEQGELVRVDAWHGSLSEAFTDKQITALHKSTVGAPSGHSRLYLGFSDGSIGWFTLPCVPVPSACDSYTFNSADGHVYLPSLHFLFQADPKALRSVTVRGNNLSSQDYVQLRYRTDPAAGWSTLANDFDSQPSEKADFPKGTAGVLCDLDVVLKSTVASSCPQVTGLGLHHVLRPALRLLCEFNVLAEDGLVRRDGTPLRLGADRIRYLVRNAVDTPGSVAVVLPDETSQEWFLVSYSEGQAWDERLRQWRAALTVKATQVQSTDASGPTVVETHGMYGNLEALGSYGALEAHTYGELETV